MPSSSQLTELMMRKGLLALLASIGVLVAPAVSAQVPELFGDTPFEVPDAPTIEIPGEMPERICTLEESHDFQANKYNPGILTAAQYRRWTIAGYDRDKASDQFFKGLMYEYGHHLKQDDLQAKRLYQQAADKGFRPAALRLAKIACAKELYCTSARAYFKAATRGNKEARMALSKHYRWGKGVFYDPVTAYQWAHLGMEKTKGNWLVNDPEGESYLRSLEDYMSSYELDLAEKKIDSWKNGFDNSPLMCKQD